MEIIQISFDQTDIEIGSLGMQGENKKVALHVDCSSVLESHPNATIIINYDRRFPGESYYNLPVTALENGIFETVLTPMEMAYDGLKYIQVRAVECDYEDRSKRFIAYVEKSVYDFRPPSGPVSDWMDELQDALEKAESAQQHGPVIGENGNWYVWQDGYYVDTGVKAGNDVSDEMITQAVSDYLAANPISETDPTVPDWAKKPNKPTYTADEVGALPNSTQIPDALSDLTEDTTHRTVTDAEKEAWNAKSDFSGSYNDLSDQPTIPDAYTLPVATAETLGGVKPVAKTEDMTQSVGVDGAGGLWALPGTSGGDGYSCSETAAEMQLATGTIAAETEALTYIDTGVTLAQIRQYKRFVFKLKGASNVAFQNVYLTFLDFADGGYLKQNIMRSDNMSGYIVVYRFVNAEKTLAMAESVFQGNTTQVANIGSNMVNKTIHASWVNGNAGQTGNVIFDLSEVAEDKTLKIYLTYAATIDYAWEIRGLTV